MRINKLGIKLVKESGINYNNNFTVSSPKAVGVLLNDLYDLENEPCENVIMLMLDTKNKVIGTHLVSKGTVNACLIDPRTVLQVALLGNAVSIIVAHNHPSGDPSPSKEDIHITKRLNDACKIVGVSLLDHIIIGHGRQMSLKEEGVL